MPHLGLRLVVPRTGSRNEAGTGKPSPTSDLNCTRPTNQHLDSTRTHGAPSTQLHIWSAGPSITQQRTTAAFSLSTTENPLTTTPLEPGDGFRGGPAHTALSTLRPESTAHRIVNKNGNKQLMYYNYGTWRLASLTVEEHRQVFNDSSLEGGGEWRVIAMHAEATETSPDTSDAQPNAGALHSRAVHPRFVWLWHWETDRSLAASYVVRQSWR